MSVYASGVDADAPCYRCFVPEAPADAATCDAIGVVGAVTGVVGARMALEAIKAALGLPGLVGKIWMFDGLSGEGRIANLRPDPECQVCGGDSFR
ncbi:MAG: hypothetical protein AAFQ67_01965 [Pseudomonadota bacterium]